MSALVLAVIAAGGAYLLYTSWVLGWRGLLRSRARLESSWHTRLAARRVDWGLTDDGVRPRELAVLSLTLLGIGGLVGWVAFGAALPALALGAGVSVTPTLATRRRHRRRLRRAQDAWPRLIDEIRVLTGSGGRSIPQALFEVGRRGPVELRPAFEAAHREWLLSTDFERTVQLLKARLTDATADAACETLLVAHELGGTDLDRRLEALADDRRQDVQDRRDAEAKQAGARFARRFVLIVPAGMAAAGMSVGNGRAAYATPLGQVAVLLALGLVLACWLWAGQLMKPPREQRVLPE